LITGATEGVGKATAMELARRRFTVVMAVRDAAKAEAVKREIAASTGNTDVDFIVADLASLKQVRRLADTFRQHYPSLDVLINNAGAVIPRRFVTEDGYEMTFQVNYLSHFLLTQLLLNEIRKSDQGRVINLGSSAYEFGKFDRDNLQGEKRFSMIGAYASSKLFVLLSTLELAKRLRGTPVTANVVHPGIVRTPMMLRAPGVLFRAISYLALPFSVAPQKGAATSVYLASSDEVRAISGKYFSRCKPTAVRDKVASARDAESLWDTSVKMLKQISAAPVE
jgi:NAD(P)-dependent dehydrogenase (short-subunit alcohol dehydrogenase family)